MKSYVFVHHRCEQDPRVVQVVQSLKEQGVEVCFVGIGSTPSTISGAIHLPLAGFWNLPFTVMLLCLPLMLALGIFMFPLLIFKKVLLKFQHLPLLGGMLNVIRCWVFPFTTAIWLFRYFITFYPFVQGKTDIDVIHCNDLETLPIGIYLKKKLNKPLICDAHEFYSHQASWLKGLPLWRLEKNEQFYLSKADYLFMVSRPLADEMKKRLELQKDFQIVPNVFSRNSIVPGIASANQPVTFHYIGGFLAERGIDFLIEHWDQASDGRAELHLRGPRNEYYEQCVAQAKKTGLLDKSIFFHDAVSEADLIEVARRYDVGIIPYKPVSLNNRYCCPNKLSQYMFAGNAILANSLPNVINLINTYENGRSYDSENIDSFVKAVQELVDATYLGLAREKSLYWARNEYNWEVQGKPFLDVYKSIKNSHHGAVE